MSGEEYKSQIELKQLHPQPVRSCEKIDSVIAGPIALKPPVWYIPSGICCNEGPGAISIQSAEVRLAMSGGQPMFTLGLHMFALSLEYFLSLPWGPSTNIDFLLMSKYHLKDSNKSYKIFYVGLKPECFFRTNIDKAGNIFHSRFSLVVPLVSSWE